MNWGDGFVRNASLIKQYGLSDPGQFFTALKRTKYKVIIRPIFIHGLTRALVACAMNAAIVIGEFGFMTDADFAKLLKIRKIDN